MPRLDDEYDSKRGDENDSKTEEKNCEREEKCEKHKHDARRSASYAKDSDDEDSDNDRREAGGPIEYPASFRPGRRNTVMAQRLNVDKNWTAPEYPKSEDEIACILDSIKNNVLFQHLIDKQLQIVAKAMKRLQFDAGERIMAEGDDGDLFYVIEKGECDIFVEGRGLVGVVRGGSEKNFFGELALLYDSKRAATVKAKTSLLTWALDRDTFKRIVMSSTLKQQTKYANFLKSVPLLSTLNHYDILTLCDGLRVLKLDEGEVVIREGDQGDDFFLIEEGEVKCTKNGEEEEVSRRLEHGDYFGELALLTDEGSIMKALAYVGEGLLSLCKQCAKQP